MNTISSDINHASDKPKSKDVFSSLLDIGVFLSFFVIGILLRSPFEFYFHYAFFFGLYPILLFKYGQSPRFLAIFMAFFLVGLFHVALGNNKLFNLIKVSVGIFLPYSFYYMYLKHIKWDIHSVMKLYLKGAYFSAFLGLIQEFFYILHFSPGYNFSWLTRKGGTVVGTDGGGIFGRVSALACEPSSLAMILAPAVFIVLLSFFHAKEEFSYLKNNQKIIIILGYFATFSSTAYMGIAFILLLITINFASFKRIILFGIISLGAFYALFSLDQGLVNRIESMQKILTLDLSKVINKKVGAVNPELYTSSLVWYNNFDVASKNFKAHPLTGTGFGSHEVAFWKYSFFRFLNDAYSGGEAVNDKDANSLFNRLMSETGLMGLSLALYIVFAYYVRNAKEIEDKRYWIYSNAFLSIILLFFARQGSYFLTGFPCFVWMYYYNYQNLQKELKEKATQQKQLAKS